MQTYLEYTEESGSGHKFYEARVDDCVLTLRYGRIGTDGQTQVKTFATPEAAQAEALKKLAEKRKKGYVDAVLGEREKRDLPHPTLRLPKALAPYRAALEATIRPYVRLNGVQAQAQVWTSKLGGVPYRPLGAAWPLSRDGHPLAFLAQLNFAELPVLPGFPAEGIVQFFVRDYEFYGANFHSGFDMVSLADDANFRVLYYAAVEQDKARLETEIPTYRPDPDGSGLPHDPAREFVLHGELVSGPVTSDDRLFDHLVGWNFAEELSEDEEEALLERYAQELHLA